MMKSWPMGINRNRVQGHAGEFGTSPSSGLATEGLYEVMQTRRSILRKYFGRRKLCNVNVEYNILRRIDMMAELRASVRSHKTGKQNKVWNVYCKSVLRAVCILPEDCISRIMAYDGSFNGPRNVALKASCCYQIAARDYSLRTMDFRERKSWIEWNSEFEASYALTSKSLAEGYIPQNLAAAVASFHDVARQLERINSINIPQDFYYHMEGVCVLATGLMSCSNVASGVAHICAFARGLSGKSIAALARTYLKTLSWTEQGSSGTDWLSALRIARQNWKMALHNPHFINMQNVLSTVVSLGLCQSADFDFSIAGIKLFSQKVRRTQATAVDLADAIITTVIAFIEGGYECFKTQSLKPLLYGNLELSMLEEQCVRCERLFEFARTGDLNTAEDGMTEQAFFKLLCDTIEQLKELRETSKSPMVTKLLTSKLDRLENNKTQFERVCNKSGLRVAPWAFLIYGPSSVGKSSLASILMVASLKQNGFPSDDVHLITNNEHDKYDSSLKSYCTGMHFDDMCNTKKDFLQTAPTANIIQTINNVRAYGNMADVNEKGKVLKEPKVVSTTTNVKNLKSTEQSECPLSIERRHAYIVTVQVKEKFATDGMLDQAKVHKHYCEVEGLDSVPTVPNLWNLKVEKAVGAKNPTPGRPQLVRYKTIHYEGKPMVDIDIYTLLRYNRDMSREHFKYQNELVKNQTNLSEKMGWCDECALPGICCGCDKMEDQVGAMFTNYIANYALQSVVRGPRRLIERFWDRLETRLENATVEYLMARLRFLEESIFMRWTNFIPRAWLENERIQRAILWTHGRQFARRVICFYILFSVPLACCLLVMLYNMYNGQVEWACLSMIAAYYFLVQIGTVVETEKVRLYSMIEEEHENNAAMFRQYREASAHYITGGCILLGTIYALSLIWKRLRSVDLTPQGNLMPTSMEDIVERDKEAKIEKEIAKEQNWAQTMVTPLPCSEKSLTATSTQLCNKVYNNLTQFSWKNAVGKEMGCDLFFVESNLALMPKHCWDADNMEITIARGSKRIQRFKAIISKSHAVFVPDSELCLVYIPNAGSWPDLRDYLPEDTYDSSRGIPAHFVYKDMRGAVPERKECETVVRFQNVVVGNSSYYGAKYNLEFKTFPGLCMGPLISRSRESVILGWHTAGVTGQKKAAMCGLLRRHYDDARAKLATISGVVICASQGKLEHQMYGVDYFISNNIHPKSPINRLAEDAHIDVYGTCIGRATYFSSVAETPIADDVCAECDVEKLYDKPKFCLGNAFEKSLDYSSRPSIGVEPDLLIKAVDDYVQPILQHSDKLPQLREHIRPLSRMETVCGIDGVRFIDKLNSNSSIGFPLSGPKLNYLEPLDSLEYPDFAAPMKMADEIWDEADRMQREYLSERRCHSPFKACLKDEPTLKTKDKVRVFQAAPAALQLLIRKYYLPLARVLSVFPILSECAVGINTMGPEYDPMVQHMRKFGENRILAGDYSKYDLRMPAQLVLAAFDVLIQMAIHYGYTEEDVVIMRGIATDIAYPVLAYNGDLIQLFGSNPSGQNLTVYINSLCNSLLLRCGFFNIITSPELVCGFRDAVAALTYGDDVKGSVKEGYDDFNHISYAKFLGDRDMVFTMPDKSSSPTKYMSEAQADFLKRKSIFCEDLDQWMGALDEQSIFKSLTSALTSKALTPLEHAMQVIDGAMREWFAYGREHYEARRLQMENVAAKHGIRDGCPMLDVSYDEYLEEYRARYGLD